MTRRADFAKKLLKVLEVKKKTHVSFSLGKTSADGDVFPSEKETCVFNVLKRGSITYYSINFNQHKRFYDFFTSRIADAFSDSICEIYRPTKENKFQGCAEIINQQRE